MFYDDGTMRKNKKSLLMQYLLNLATDSREIQENIKAVAFDGGALILPWPKIGTMETVCGMYVDLVTSSNPEMFLKLLCLIIMRLLQQKTMRRNVVICNLITQLMSVLHPIIQFLVIKVFSFIISVTSSPSSIYWEGR